MYSNDPSIIFNAYYYEHGCGRPYQRDEHWLKFFDMIAEKIISGIQPKTVLDAGCAMGFLVEKLRDRGVDAWGVDISEYAIQNAHPDIQQYCWKGSVIDPFPQRYGLIVCLEVLEHMNQLDSERALINLCQHSDDILFSSTPLDYKETTHFNVQSIEYWAELFAQHGFYRDVDFDASFIMPWATRFRRTREPLPRVVRDYERKFWPLWKENADLRSLNLEMVNQLETNQKEHADLLSLNLENERELKGKDQLIHNLLVQVEELGQIANEYINIMNSRSWKLIQRVHKLRHRIIPLDSRLERLMYSVFRASVSIRHRGILATFRRILRRVGTQGKNGDGRYELKKNKIEYETWIAETDVTIDELTLQKEKVKEFSEKPLISVIMPVFNPPPHILRETVESVLAQSYEAWEMCIVDGCSKDPEIKEILNGYTQRDPRIRVNFLEQNLGISGNSNIALEMSQGEFIAILDHDDMLSPNALYEVIYRINEKPNSDLIYFDEDKISEDGEVRRDPFFKPDWSPELLLSANYLMHSVIRRSLMNDVGHFDKAMDGAQDWDLMFRCTERTNKIEHIPKVLYHWRQLDGSTSDQINAKSWVFERQKKCVENHLRRQGVKQARADFPSPGILRVKWPTSGAKVSIIIPTKDKMELLKRCLDSLFRLTTYSNYEIIIVNNKSREGKTLNYFNQLLKNNSVRIIDYHERFNYSVANNLGADHASGDFFLFLNNDIEIMDPDWLEELVRWVELPEVGTVGAKLLYPDGTVQHAGVVLGMEGHASHVFWGAKEKQSGPFGSVDWYRNYLAVTGACMMMHRDVFEEVHGFDENYVLAFGDVDICLRVANKGYRVMYTPFARLRHFEGRTRGKHIPAEDIQVGFQKFMDVVEKGDPYFNPNLSYLSRMPKLANVDEETRVERLKRINALSK